MLPEQAIKDKSKLFIECFLARCIFTTKMNSLSDIAIEKITFTLREE